MSGVRCREFNGVCSCGDVIVDSILSGLSTDTGLSTLEVNSGIRVCDCDITGYLGIADD